MAEGERTLKTPLHAAHVALGARMAPFAGWEMPIQYTGILEEHRAVRQATGVFDISHMGEFFFSGAGAAAWLNGLLTNDISRLSPGEGHYTLLLNERGGVIDDLIAYRIGADEYFLVVNASKIDEDAAWMRGHLQAGVSFEDRSEGIAAVALQGPRAIAVFSEVFGAGATAPERFHIASFDFGDARAIIARTGYTGEDGVEIFVPSAAGAALWDRLLAAGAKPAGLGARDTLRLESCYPLNGHELGPERTPLEAGLRFAVALEKIGGFLGAEVLRSQAAAGLKERLVAFSVEGAGAPPRAGYSLFSGQDRVGEVTSGTFSPSLARGIGMAYVAAASASPGTRLEMEVRGRRVPVVIARKPLYKGGLYEGS
ncbi:MAG TPA: glycine cleavage system aminomethyltransferase GcvT [Verrucomicrobiae bacterium]|nr:glycine cleavage system aminomethyltransferase GcvT [Verrucomicrobiae bacterium]